MTRKHLNADAILWDFDGTLADSAAKNIAITKQIMARIAPHRAGDNLPVWLQNTVDYHKAIHSTENWRDLYRDYFDLSPEDIRAAAPLWQEYQARDKTEVTLFDGILETISELAWVPMGISSANSSKNINRVLNNNGISSFFRSVIGYENFSPETEKPAADPGLKCLDEVLEDCQGKTIIYVGDHIADVIFSRNIADRLGPTSNVISVVVTYSGAQPEHWRVQPDKVIDKPTDLVAWFRD